MTTAPLEPSLPLDPPRGAAWKGRLAELLAVGGLTPLLFALSWLLRRHVARDDAELAVGFTMFHAAFVINDPHFTVTYLLFYEDARARAFGGAFDRAQRLRWLAAGVGAPLILGAWIAVALATRSPALLSALIQLMFFLVGWHYVKQGFGVFLALAARRGVRFAPRERLAILAHCLAGWAYAWASPFDPGRLLEEKGVVYRSLAHPIGLERLTQIVFFASALPLAWTLARKWRREGRLPILTPLTALLSSVWIWSVYSGADPLVRYMIPALHSVQYLYFVKQLKGGAYAEREGPPWFEPSARTRLGTLFVSAIGIGVVVFHAGPSLLDGALVPRGTEPTLGSLGPTPWWAAIYAFVNVHHYLMDAVLWRRENPETRYLHAAPS